MFNAEKKKKKNQLNFWIMQKYFEKVSQFFEEENLTQCLECTDEAPVTQSLIDQEIISSVFNWRDLHSDIESDEEEIKITHEEGLAVGYKYIEFLQKHNYIFEQEVFNCTKTNKKKI